jgi:hypothetical protein
MIFDGRKHDDIKTFSLKNKDMSTINWLGTIRSAWPVGMMTVRFKLRVRTIKCPPLDSHGDHYF